jgi:hypothetical protein
MIEKVQAGVLALLVGLVAAVAWCIVGTALMGCYDRNVTPWPDVCVEDPSNPACQPPEPEPSKVVTCDKACQHLRSIGCPEGDAPCEASCEAHVESGISTLDTRCMYAAVRCSDLDGCTE